MAATVRLLSSSAASVIRVCGSRMGCSLLSTKAAVSGTIAHAVEGSSEWTRKRAERGGAMKEMSSGVGLEAAAAAAASSKDFYAPIRSVHLGRRLDFRQLALDYQKENVPHLVQRDSVVVDLTPTREVPGEEVEPTYAVMYRYGSIVFINVRDERIRDGHLRMAQKYAFGAQFPRCAEDYGVKVSRSLEPWSIIDGDHLIVRALDLNSVRVIGAVMGQTVALDHYAQDVDAMLQVFMNLNDEMEKTGAFSMKKERLFQLVAQNNTTLTDLVNNLKLLDRSDTAWKYAQYGEIWEALRTEFELEDRFEALEYKLNLVQHNVKFFLEILQNRKSDTLEWIIIILITGEICVSLYDIFTR